MVTIPSARDREMADATMEHIGPFERDYMREHIAAALARRAAEEREACAKVAECTLEAIEGTPAKIAAAIRARGEEK